MAGVGGAYGKGKTGGDAGKEASAMKVICRFQDRGPSLRERLLQLLIARTGGGDGGWTGKK